MTTQKFTPEELFAEAIKSMKAELDRLQEEVEQAEQWLGKQVADNPSGDHRDRIEGVNIARAKLEGARTLWHIAFGLHSVSLVPRKTE